MEALVRVYPWPHSAADALAALRSEAGCVVISVATPNTENRTPARWAIRLALQELLARFWQRPVASIGFTTATGQPLALHSPAVAVGLSISHAPGCSVAAVHLRRAIGVDVMQVAAALDASQQPLPDWEALARDYLGPVAHAMLLRSAPAQRGRALAQAWCHREAQLKCQGLGLEEWSTAQARALPQCAVNALDWSESMPGLYCGALAVGAAILRNEVLSKPVSVR